MRGQAVVIPAATTGSAQETAVGLAATAATGAAARRNREQAAAAAAEVRARSGRDDVQLADLDLADLDSVAQCAKAILDRFDRIDVLINNAGLQLKKRTTTKQGFETTFG